MRCKAKNDVRAASKKLNVIKHELLVMRTDLTAFEYRHGLTIDFTKITSGECAPVEQPIVVYQKTHLFGRGFCLVSRNFMM